MWLNIFSPWLKYVPTASLHPSFWPLAAPLSFASHLTPRSMVQAFQHFDFTKYKNLGGEMGEVEPS